MAVEHTQAHLETVRAFVAERRRQRQRSLESRLKRARRNFCSSSLPPCGRYHPYGLPVGVAHRRQALYRALGHRRCRRRRHRCPSVFKLFGVAETLTDLPLDIVQIEHVHPAYTEGIRRRGRIVYERGS